MQVHVTRDTRANADIRYSFTRYRKFDVTYRISDWRNALPVAQPAALER